MVCIYCWTTTKKCIILFIGKKEWRGDLKMKNKIFILALIVLLSGCYAYLLPKSGPDVTISSSGLIAEQESQGIKVSVNGEMSKFTKFDKYTPIFLTIKNKTDKIISLEYENFTLLDEANNTFKPFSIKEVYGSVENNKSVKETSFSYIPDNKPFQLVKWNGKFTGNNIVKNREVLANKNKVILPAKKNRLRPVKDGSKGKKRGYVYIYPFYDPFYNPFFDYPYYPYYPYGPYGPYRYYYWGRFYPYDYYYNGYYNPYMPYSSQSYKEAYYSPLPMDILPHREVSGYLYFPQVIKTAKRDIKLSVDIKEAGKVMNFSFKINK